MTPLKSEPLYGPVAFGASRNKWPSVGTIRPSGLLSARDTRDAKDARDNSDRRENLPRCRLTSEPTGTERGLKVIPADGAVEIKDFAGEIQIRHEFALHGS